MHTPEFQRHLQAWLRTEYPDQGPAETFVVKFRSGREIHSPISAPVDEPTAADKAIAKEELAENMRYVLNFLPAGDKPGMKTSQITEKTGYSDDSYTRKILRALRKRKEVEIAPEGGYRRISTPQKK